MTQHLISNFLGTHPSLQFWPSKGTRTKAHPLALRAHFFHLHHAFLDLPHPEHFLFNFGRFTFFTSMVIIEIIAISSWLAATLISCLGNRRSRFWFRARPRHLCSCNRLRARSWLEPCLHLRLFSTHTLDFGDLICRRQLVIRLTRQSPRGSFQAYAHVQISFCGAQCVSWRQCVSAQTNRMVHLRAV